LNVKILNFDEANSLTDIPDVSSLLNLEEFSFKNCKNLITIHKSVGLLDKLKVLSAYGCINLRRFPPIKLMSLEHLHLSYCLNLKSFPEILGKMENITRLVLTDTPIIELPCSFQNLTHLKELELHECGTNISLPSNIFMMPNLVKISASDLEGWILPKQSEGRQRVISMVSSNVECLSLVSCKLSNDFFSTDLTWFRNVKELILSDNDFTILPECIKEYHLLRELYLDRCKYLREVRGIPPNLKIFSALWCESLTSNEMLLNQVFLF
jgi:Leucine-rich repeat (LRR) protein